MAKGPSKVRSAGIGISGGDGEKRRYGQPVRRRLSRMCWILVLVALVAGCTQASTLTRSPSPSRAVDYAAMETAIEDEIVLEARRKALHTRSIGAED